MPESSDELVPLAQDLDFTTLALAHRVLARDQVDAAQKTLDQETGAGRPRRPIEQILLEKGSVTADQVWAVYKARERLLKDARSKGQRIGNYEVLDKVGEGGLGVVYRARQLSMGRVVALKVLHERWVGDDEFRKRFLVEARLVGRLSHPNLIQVIDVGRYRNTLYYSMEFVDGETVEARLDRERVLDLAAALAIVFQVARALQYLQTRQIVHRDVKPGNIMLAKGGVAKLGDFGFVKSSLDSVLSTTGEVLGTPDYISPEAARGDKNMDFRSDQYSLGATLYHMLGGRPPFGGAASDVMNAHIKESPTPLAELRPDLPARAFELVDRMMQKNPADRFGGFDELVSSLERLRQDATGVRPLAGTAKTDDDEQRARERALRAQIRRLKRVAFAFGLGMLLFLLYAVLRWLR
jgi:serine/threonine-protein kinase